MADQAVVRPSKVAARPARAAVAQGDLERPDEVAAKVTARLSGRRVLVTDLTSETSQTWALPDGSLQTEQHLGPVRVRQGGTWVPVDLTLVRQADGSVASKVHPGGLRLSGAAGTGDHDLVAVGVGGQRVVLGWRGALPEPVLSGTRATYADVRPGVDLVVEATRTGFEQFLVVKTRQAAASLSSVALPWKWGALSRTSTSDGSVVLTDKGGAPVGQFGSPVMWDASVDALSGEHTRRRAVGMTRQRTGAGEDLVLSPDTSFLTDPATTYPVTIDPSVSISPMFDGFVESDYTSDQSGATELRLGTYNGGSAVARSFLRWNTTALRGTQIVSATLNLYNFHSWSCSAREWQVWRTTWVGPSVRWTSQPTWDSGVTVAKSTATTGNTGCAAGWVSADAKNVLQYGANNSFTETSMGLRATSETDSYAWKKFNSMEASSGDPYLSVRYNHAPGTPTNLAMSNCWLQCSSPARVSSLQATLSGTVPDADGDAIRAEFEVWSADYSTKVAWTNNAVTGVPAGGTASWQMNTPRANNTAYHWRMRSYDGNAYSPWSGYFDFTTDVTAPGAPSVSSSDYPAGVWSKQAGQSGTFTLTPPADADVGGLLYGLDTNPPTTLLQGTTAATVTLTPATDGPHTLYVQAKDIAGNVSPVTSYVFNVGQGGLTSPKVGDISGSQIALTSAAAPTATGVTYQWRRAETDSWVDIPTADVQVADGGGAVTWPRPVSGGVVAKLNWNLSATLADVDAQQVPRDGPLQVRALFAGSNWVSSPISIKFDRNLASASTSDVGPGAVNLITGNLGLSATDVSVDAYGSDLTLTRSYNSRQAAATDDAHMFGPGWVSGAVVVDANAPYTGVHVYGSLVQAQLPEGDTIGFTAKSATAFTPEVGMEDLTLTRNTTADTYTLTDTDGTSVTFSRISGAPDGQYQPTAVTTPGNGQTTTYAWQTTTVDGTTVTRPTRMLAPAPAGVTCGATLVRGCRALAFTYAATTSATGANADQWGDYAGRVTQIDLVAWDPDAAAMKTVPMARYAYDTTGRLRAVWDPRLDHDGGQHLQTTYDYNADGTLRELTPPAQPAWNLAYTTLPADPGAGRLASVSRTALDAGTATTTVVYKVPLSGTGAPADLSNPQTARWGQSEAPVDATAVFGPDQVPNGNQATGVLPSSWERADITYLDANARTLNTVTPGGYTTATWYDQYGNTVRSLSAANRDRALSTSSTDTPEDEAELARSLSTLNIYSSNGVQLLQTFGPEHDVALPDGSTTRGRAHTVNTYDEGAPSGGPYNLVTTAVTSLRYWDTTGTAHDADARTTTTGYDWALRQPTLVTEDPGGLALTTRTTYDATTGLVTSTTTPAGGTSTTTPATRSTVYYRAGTGSGYTECDNHPEWANLACRAAPGGQAGTGPEIPATLTTYDLYNQPRVATEKTSAGTLRTTTTTYDTAGRVYQVDTTGADGTGTPVPGRRTRYDPATGLATHTQSIDSTGAVTAQTVTQYDALGRVTHYTDTDNNTTLTTYDLLGRVATTNDGKALRTLHYDTGTERRGLLTQVDDAQAGTFTGGYDPDGKLVTEAWPNAITVTHTLDETGSDTALLYTKANCGQDDCTLYTEEAADSIHNEQARHASSLSTQTYGYDQTGRLTTVNDTLAGQCTTRQYGFNTATDRTSLTTYGPNTDGTCQTSSPASTTTWTYGTADRTTTSGYTYDSLGRATTVPAADTQTPTTGDLSVAYHVNDLVRSITQGTRTATYTLDVDTQRVRSWTDNATGTAITRTHHYDGTDDNPAWTDEGNNTWTRTVAGLSTLAAITTGGASTATTWQIVNLHGDTIATIHDTDTGLTSTSEANEYGVTRDAAQAGVSRYGWLGSKQRAADTPAGILIMGVRLYNPTTGRFLQTDPVQGGSANPYDYCNGDPVNGFDLDGRWGWKNIRKFWHNHGSAVNLVVGALAMVPVLAPVFGPLAIACAGFSAYVDWSYHSYRSAAWDVAAALPGVGAISRGARAARAYRTARAVAQARRGQRGVKAAARSWRVAGAVHRKWRRAYNRLGATGVAIDAYRWGRGHFS